MSTPRLEEGRNFANKLWNAARFVVTSRPAEVAEGAPLAPPAATDLGAADEWILARCGQTIGAVEAAYGDYEFGRVAHLLYDAIWSEYCDWYLEMAKLALSAESTPQRREATWRTLSWVLDRYLRLLHPVMPHVTEEIWGRLPHLADDPELLIVAAWPTSDEGPALTAEGLGVELLKDMITSVRGARAEAGIAAGDIVDAWILFKQPSARAAFDALRTVTERLARIRATVIEDRPGLDAAGPGSIGVITASGEARLTRSGADVARERARLEKELRNSEGALEAADERLEDPNFIGRAPAPIVEQAQRRAADLREQVAALRARLG
jgi:valyl-tRNA synthetase